MNIVDKGFCFSVLVDVDTPSDHVNFYVFFEKINDKQDETEPG